MSTSRDGSVILQRPGNGDAEAANLFPLVYSELRELATQYLRGERPHHTWGPTDLVHEAYLRLANRSGVTIEDPRHVFALAARAMRHLLVDHARARHAIKRGEGNPPLPLEVVPDLAPDRDQNLVALDEALARLARLDSELGQIVELRFFGGLTVEETAHVLGASPKTIQRRWNLARSWLHREIAVS